MWPFINSISGIKYLSARAQSSVPIRYDVRYRSIDKCFHFLTQLRLEYIYQVRFSDKCAKKNLKIAWPVPKLWPFYWSIFCHIFTPSCCTFEIQHFYYAVLPQNCLNFHQFIFLPFTTYTEQEMLSLVLYYFVGRIWYAAKIHLHCIVMKFQYFGMIHTIAFHTGKI